MTKTKSFLERSGFRSVFDKIWNIKPHTFYTVLALFFGVIAAFIMPPLTVPDEQVHFLSVLKVSHFQFLPTVINGKEGVFLSVGEIEFLEAYRNDVYSPTMNFADFFRFKAQAYKPTEFYVADGAGVNPLAYIVSGFGLALVRFVFPFINVHFCLIIARLFNLVTAVILTRQAIKVTPVLKNVMLLLVLMPMTIHQTASTSYDSLLISASMLLFAYVMKIVLEKENYVIGAKDIVAVCVACAILFGTKILYAALVVVLLLIPKKKIGTWKKYFSLVGVIALIGVFFYLIPSLAVSFATSDIDNYSPLVATQKDYFFSNFPWLLPRIVLDTTKTLFEPLSREFFGVLGWLVLSFPMFHVILFYTAFLFVFLVEICNSGTVKLRIRFVLFFAFLIVSIGAMLGMYLLHTPRVDVVGGTIAIGLQGRYFIPCAIFGLCAFSNSLLDKISCKNTLLVVSEKVSQATALFCGIETVRILLWYYW